jgi:predicted metalloenzyme YecM
MRNQLDLTAVRCVKVKMFIREIYEIENKLINVSLSQLIMGIVVVKCNKNNIKNYKTMK